MITDDRLRRYSFLGCDLQLIHEKHEKLFFVRVTSSSPEWELTTPIPKRCPFEALMLGELEVLKTRAKSSPNPACVVQALTREIEGEKRTEALIVGFNRKFKVFNCHQLKKSVLNLEEYGKVLDLVKNNKKEARLQLITEDGHSMYFVFEAQKSQASVVNWLYGEAVP